MTSTRPGQLSDAVQAIRLGQKSLAREILAAILEAEPRNEQAWIWSAAVAESPEAAILSLERVLEMNPRNELAAKTLAAHRLTSRQSVGAPVRSQVDASASSSLTSSSSTLSSGLSSSHPSSLSSPSQAAPRAVSSRPTPELTISLHSPARPPQKSQLCFVCSQPRLENTMACDHCGCAYSLRDVPTVNANSSVNEKVVEQALQRLTSTPPMEASYEELLGASIAYLSLYRSGEALPLLIRAAAVRPQDYHVRVLCEDLAARRLVLVVDDSATVRRLVSITLERQGYRVRTAVHGRDGLAKYEAELPDLILLDITMPEMDGYEFCKTIRRQHEGKQLPIVMLSGNDGIFDKVRGKVAGATDYLNKPFHSEVLLNAIRKYLRAAELKNSKRIFDLV